MTAPLIEIRGLKKTIVLPDGKEQVVLEIDALDIPRGEFVCILGPSGCGKTTLLGILGLVDGGFEGRLTYHLKQGTTEMERDGRRGSWSTASELRRSIGYVFQDIRLRSDVSALRNVIDPLVYVGMGTPTSRHKTAHDMLERVEIDGRFRDMAVSAYSGGMQQRTAIARALSVGPELICADEPTAHLDAKLAHEVYGYLRDRAREAGVTVLVVTHDRQLAETFADRVVEVHEVAGRPGGAWPYRIEVSRKHETAPAAGTVEPPKRAGLIRRTSDMMSEALAEFRPLFSQLGFWGGGFLARGLLRLIGRPLPPRDNPAHLYMPPLVALLTFGLLAGVGFFFFSLQTGLQTYLDDVLHAMEAARRVRIEDAATQDGVGTTIDGDDLVAYANSEQGIAVDQVRPNYGLQLCAYTPGDLRILEREGDLEACRNSVTWTPETRTETRHWLDLLAVDPTDPIAKDLGMDDAVAEYTAGDDDTLPGIYLAQVEMDWVKFGNFVEMPLPGDELAISVRSITKVQAPAPPPPEPEAADPSRSGEAPADPVDAEAEVTEPEPPPPERIYDCIKIRVADFIRPPPPPLQFKQRVSGQIVNGTLRSEAFHRILAWQYDPLGSPLPDAWRCTDEPATTDAYTYPEEPREPVPSNYDVFAERPEDVLALEALVERYADARDVTFGAVISEKEFVEAIVQVLTASQWLGTVLYSVPIVVAAIVLWLVTATILQRRRDELLLFVVMGTPVWQLRLLCFFIAVLIAVPGLVMGWGLGSAMVPFAADSISSLGLPADLTAALASSTVGLTGVLTIGLLAIVLAAVASTFVVGNITSSNPADAFRGH